MGAGIALAAWLLRRRRRRDRERARARDSEAAAAAAAAVPARDSDASSTSSYSSSHDVKGRQQGEVKMEESKSSFAPVPGRAELPGQQQFAAELSANEVVPELPGNSTHPVELP